jgi:eukaryotic translation initiation factor 2C
MDAGRKITDRHMLQHIVTFALPRLYDADIDPNFKVFTDYFDSIVSLDPLPNFILNVGEGRTNTTSQLMPGRTIAVTITRLPDQDTTRLADWQPGQAFIDNTDVLNPLNIMAQFPVREQSVSQNWFKAAKNKFFETSGLQINISSPNRHASTSGLHLRRGFFVSIRPAEQNKLFLNLNAVTSAFFNAGTVLDLVKGYFSSNLQPGNRRELETLLKGLRLRFVLQKTAGVFKMLQEDQYMTLGFSYRACEVETDLKQIETLVSPELLQYRKDRSEPAIYIDRKTPRTLIPASLLWIEPHQPLRAPLSPRLSDSMINAARKSPTENLALINENYRPALNSSNSELQTAAKPIVIKSAKILHPPRIYYDKVSLDPKKLSAGTWNLQGMKLTLDRPFGHALFLIRESQKKSGLEEMCKRFITNINTTCKPGHIVAQTRFGYVQNFEPQSLETWYAAMKKQPLPHVYILLDPQSQGADTFADIKKFLVIDKGIPSNCMQLQKFIRDHRSLAFTANIALKVNLQYQGKNQHTLLSIPRNTMIVGADVTHPGQAAVEGAPSVAAVVASNDENFAHYPGSARLQIGKQEMIEDLEEMMLERLNAYVRKNDQLPDNILVFRDGVSDGQFPQVKEKEVPQVHSACRKLCKEKGKQTEIRVTFVITSKRHNSRFFKTANTNRNHLDRGNENFNPGLVVDDTIISPGRNDFYMQSHKALAGTARPCHYFVMENGMNLSSFELQTVVSGLS